MEAPSLELHLADALTPEQAIRFFGVLKTCPLEFRAILHLLLTTGVRHGECMVLEWIDIDLTKHVLHIERGVSYTSRTGIVVSTPKTKNSILTKKCSWLISQSRTHLFAVSA